MAALKSRWPDMEATVIGSLFQKLMILTKKEYLYTLICECLHTSVKRWDLEEEFLNLKNQKGYWEFLM